MRTPWRWNGKYGSVALVLAVSALLRIVWVFLVPVHPVSDSTAYDVLAKNLASGLGYVFVPGVPTAFWPVGTPFVYSIFYREFGPSYAPIEVFNILLSLATIWLTMVLAQRWFNRKIAILSGLIFAVWPLQIEFTSVLASELMFNFLLLALLAIWELGTFNRWSKAIVLGVLTAATCYIRPVALLLPILLLILECIRERKVFRPLASTAILYLTMALLIAPWSIRNTRDFGHFEQISTNGGVNLWDGNHPVVDGVPDERPAAWWQMPEGDRDLFFGKVAKDYIRAYPGRFVVRSLGKAVWLYDHESIGVHWNLPGLVGAFGEGSIKPLKIISNLYWWLILLLGLAGAVLFFVRRGAWTAVTSLPILMWLYFTAIYAIIVAQDRYHFAALPFIGMLAAMTLEALWERLRTRNPKVTTAYRP